MPENTDYIDFSEVVENALRDDRDVTLELAEGYGWNMYIDGVRVTDWVTRGGQRDEGMPWELLNSGRGWTKDLSDEARELVRELSEI